MILKKIFCGLTVIFAIFLSDIFCNNQFAFGFIGPRNYTISIAPLSKAPFKNRGNYQLRTLPLTLKELANNAICEAFNAMDIKIKHEDLHMEQYPEFYTMLTNEEKDLRYLSGISKDNDDKTVFNILVVFLLRMAEKDITEEKVILQINVYYLTSDRDASVMSKGNRITINPTDFSDVQTKIYDSVYALIMRFEKMEKK